MVGRSPLLLTGILGGILIGTIFAAAETRASDPPFRVIDITRPGTYVFELTVVNRTRCTTKDVVVAVAGEAR